MHETFGIKVFGEEVDDHLVFMPVVELQFGIAKALIEDLVGVCGIFFNGDGGDVGLSENFERACVGVIFGGAGEDDATNRIVFERITIIENVLKSAVGTGGDDGDIACF